MLDSTTRKRFEDALASDTLRTLAMQFVVEGYSQVAIYRLFEAFRDFVDDAIVRQTRKRFTVLWSA